MMFKAIEEKGPALFQFFTIIAVCLIGLSIYSHTLDVPFYFDDNGTIVKNPLIRNIFNFGYLWQYDPSRFITHYTFAVNYFFSALNPRGYHIFNIALHLLTTLSFFTFLRLTSQLHNTHENQKNNILVLAAFIFLTHPLQTQGVTYISQRSTLLASLCYFNALNFYICFRLRPKQRFYIVSLLFAFCGLFTKPIIITLPFCLILYEIFFLKGNPQSRRKLTLSLLPYLIFAMAVPLLLMLWRYKTLPIENLLDMTRQTQHFTRWEYLLTQFNVIMTYIRLLFFPLGQSLDYDYPIVKSFFVFPTWLSFIVLCFLFVLALNLFRRKKEISFGLFWMFLTLSLESSIFPIADVIFEHRLYLPMAGFAMIVAYTLAHYCNGKKYIIGAMLIILICSCLTYNRNQEWRDITSFHENMIERFPRKVRLHNNIGNIYMADKEYGKAKKSFLKAIELAPKYYKTYNNIANIYMVEGDYDKSAESLKKAIDLNPAFTEAYINLGNLYLNYKKVKNPPLAGQYYNAALRTNPNYTVASVGLGRVYLEYSDFNRSRFYLENALRIDPTNPAPYTFLGDLHAKKNEYNRAIMYYRQALRINPQLHASLNNLANVLAITGQRQEAISLYLKALEMKADFPEPYLNLAEIYLKKGDVSKHKLFLEKGTYFKNLEK